MLQDFNRHEIKVLTSENHADRVKVWCSTVQTAYDPQQVLVAGLGGATRYNHAAQQRGQQRLFCQLQGGFPKYKYQPALAA